MARVWTGLARPIVMAVVLLASACAPIERRHGYAPTDAQLQDVIVGVDTQATVADAVGRPTAAGVLQNSGWYYVESNFRTFGPFEKREIDREVVAITFDERGTVSNIERFGLERGRAIVLSRRVTDSNIEGVSILRQLLGNISAFDSGALADAI
jgi:Small protein A (tmRNA-binding)